MTNPQKYNGIAHIHVHDQYSNAGSDLKLTSEYPPILPDHPSSFNKVYYMDLQAFPLSFPLHELLLHIIQPIHLQHKI